MYDKYFSQDEIKQLPLYNAADAVKAEWTALVESVRALMESAAGPPPPTGIGTRKPVDDDGGARYRRQRRAVRQTEHDARAGTANAGQDRHHTRWLSV